MSQHSPLTSPQIIINNYLVQELMYRLPHRFSAGPPLFLPTSPSNINSIGTQDAEEVFAIYDRMFRLRRDPFPHIKKEQLLYYFYKVNKEPEALFEVIQVVYDLLDRGDDSAKDVNAYVAEKSNDQGYIVFGSGNSSTAFRPVYFHEMKVFQLEESRDIEGFDSTNTFFASKMIVNYDYHVQGYGNFGDQNNDIPYKPIGQR